MFAVIRLDKESDCSGIDVAFGPFDSWDDASAAADSYCARKGLIRGDDVQAITLNNPSFMVY